MDDESNEVKPIPLISDDPLHSEALGGVGWKVVNPSPVKAVIQTPYTPDTMSRLPRGYLRRGRWYWNSKPRYRVQRRPPAPKPLYDVDGDRVKRLTPACRQLDEYTFAVMIGASMELDGKNLTRKLNAIPLSVRSTFPDYTLWRWVGEINTGVYRWGLLRAVYSR